MPLLWALIAIVLIIITIIIIKKVKRKKYLRLIDNYFQELLQLKQKYISYNDLTNFKLKFNDLYKIILNKNNNHEKFQKFLQSYSNLDKDRKIFNEEFIKNELIKYDDLFSNIDEKSLDLQQRMACVINEDANLVIAGAGSGKTLTICGKIKYLLDKGVRPENILCISFTNKVCDELKDRLKKISGQTIDVLTFHKVAIQILKQCGDNRAIADENKSNQMIEKAFNGLRNKDIAISDLYALVCAENYIKDHIEANDDNKNLFTIKNLIDHVYEIRELQSFMRDSVQLKTLCTERVKSEYELDIANYLFLNGIDYEYERPYPFEENDKDKFDYKPDFYLPEYNIYIEHFGIDESGKANWLVDKRKIEKYDKEMKAKIEFHKKKKNNLICTYSYEKDKLLFNLHDKLEEFGVEFRPCSNFVIESFNQIADYDSYLLNTIESFIKMFKSKGLSALMFDTFLKENKKFKLTIREKQLLLIIKSIYYEYQKELENEQLMDFDDIINLANEYFKEREIFSKYKYIVVDEYQDVSINKVRLLTNLMNVNNARLVAVGDDWQSIYRFAGSEVSLISNFNHTFQHSEIIKIEKVYRNPKELIEIASKFIQKNDNQIKKNLKTDKHIKNPIEIMSFNGKLVLVPKMSNIEEKESVVNISLTDSRYHTMIKTLDRINISERKNILLLTRNNEDYTIIKVWLKNPESKLVAEKNSRNQVIFHYKNLRITCMTIHKSKGLEADDVILFDIKEGNRGLPDTLGDEKILRIVTSSNESIDYAEDRRLFYVALTRTKGKVYIINNLRQQSRFITELITDNETIISDCEENHCPLCNGYLVKIDKYGFYGCSNYATKNCPFKLFANSHEEMIEKSKVIHSIFPELQKQKPISMCAKVVKLTKQIAPMGNLCIKIDFEISKDNVVLGDLTTYINKTTSKIEMLKLEQFINSVSQTQSLDLFEEFDKIKKKFINRKISITVRSKNWGQKFEFCNENNIYYSPYRKRKK